ncbi:MAG TPA: RES family NAD+ phosphorylase [Conexibacter sp.]|nr:RES family NAD+ phosphorylase [Conexibacter sp.]
MPSWTSEPAAVAGRWVAYRHVAQGVPPLWYGAGSTTLRQESGRWHREGESLVQYLALSSDGAWAERVRYEALRTEADRIADHRSLWQLRVSAERIADLSSFDKWEACGLDPAVAVGDHAESQALASELRRARYAGVLSPSAALDVAGAVNLTLFGGFVEQRVSGLALPDEPVGGAGGGPWLPAILLTDRGAPTPFAMEHACYRFGHHRTLAEWRAARGGAAVSGRARTRPRGRGGA